MFRHGGNGGWRRSLCDTDMSAHTTGWMFTVGTILIQCLYGLGHKAIRWGQVAPSGHLAQDGGANTYGVTSGQMRRYSAGDRGGTLVDDLLGKGFIIASGNGATR